MFRTKSVEAINEDTAGDGDEGMGRLRKHLSARHLVGFGIGVVIGTAPGRDLPLGLLGTLGISAALYIGVSPVVVGMVPYDQIYEGAPIADAFDQVGLGWAAALVSIAAVAGLTSVILVDLVTVTRIGFAMGRDGLLPPTWVRFLVWLALGLCFYAVYGYRHSRVGSRAAAEEVPAA